LLCYFTFILVKKCFLTCDYLSILKLLDLTNTYHKLFFHELLTLSEAEDATLAKLDCYKNVPNLIPLRTSALRALAACHYISDIGYKEKIINIIFKVMENDKSELQETAYLCMKHFISGVTLEKEKVRCYCVTVY